MICPLCNREADYFSSHHLIPKSKCGKITEEICVPCHNTIHKIYTNNELRDSYNTIDSIRNQERFQKYLKWIRKKPPEFIPCFKKKK